MGTHFYVFAKTIYGKLLFQYKLKNEMIDNVKFGIIIKDIDLENTKADFLINRNRIVKNGKTWLKNYLKYNL